MADRCFLPIAAPDARVLILGSLPGRMSLARQQYYALPQNAFWKIMGRLVGADPGLPYAARVDALMAHRIAVWDVCAAAERPGSLDSAIVQESVIANDFESFLAAHPHIALICFNGIKAEALFRRLVSPALSQRARQIPTVRLPSTSPAHAGMPFEQKLALWQAAIASMTSVGQADIETP